MSRGILDLGYLFRRRQTLVWISNSQKRMSILGLLEFAAHLRAKRRILVFVNAKHSKRVQMLLGLASILRFFEIVHIKNTRDFYTEHDFELTHVAQAIADHIAGTIIPAALIDSDYKFDADEMSDIATGVKLSLWDYLYSRIQRTLIVIKACKISDGSEWVDYGNSHPFQDDLAQSTQQFRSGHILWPDRIAFGSDKSDRIGRAGRAVQVQMTSAEKPDTLICGASFRQAYVDSVKSIIRAERLMGRHICVALPKSKTPGADLLAHDAESKIISSVTTELPGRKQVRQFLKLCQVDDSAMRVRAIIEKADPLLQPRFGINQEVWLNLVVTMSLEIINLRLEAISEFYDTVVRGADFSNLKTAIFIPSRSLFYLPILFALKRRGVQLIEYQPFFWSAHPRYIVQDVDLFVCSDGATQKVIASKVAAKGFSAKIVPGPSFGIAGFLADFREVSKRPQPVGQSRLIGLALQPVNQDIFLAACKLIIEEGFEVVIRPHPSQSLRDVEALFGSYGPIDTGTLASFVHRSFIVVTGFSNVALQTALVGRTAVCLPVPNELGLNLADASDRILICEDFEDLRKFLHQPVENSAAVTFPDPIDQWCEIRRENR